MNEIQYNLNNLPKKAFTNCHFYPFIRVDGAAIGVAQFAVVAVKNGVHCLHPLVYMKNLMMHTNMQICPKQIWSL